MAGRKYLPPIEKMRGRDKELIDFILEDLKNPELDKADIRKRVLDLNNHSYKPLDINRVLYIFNTIWQQSGKD
jgi:hypothetical protein